LAEAVVKGLLAFSRGVDRLNGWFGVIAYWLVLLSVLVSAGNAAARKLFSLSSNGLLEVQWYMFAAVVFLGAGYTLLRNEHVRVDVVYGQLPRRARLAVDIFGIVVFLLPAAIFLGWLCWPVFVRAFESGEVSSNYGGLLRWPVLLVLPVGFALLVLQALSELIKRVVALTGRLDLDTSYEKPTQ
jgi:TRAP-type mannitol/chloroaromatic compound transport system permease small subunit